MTQTPSIQSCFAFLDPRSRRARGGVNFATAPLEISLNQRGRSKTLNGEKSRTGCRLGGSFSLYAPCVLASRLDLCSLYAEQQIPSSEASRSGNVVRLQSETVISHFRGGRKDLVRGQGANRLAPQITLAGYSKPSGCRGCELFRAVTSIATMHLWV